jgi:hypothetical protein
MIYLKMQEELPHLCPFAEEKEGCRVYPDRPGVCRTFPLGRAYAMDPGGGGSGGFYFLVRAPHCRGFEAAKTWTVSTWLKDQGMEPYDAYNHLWMEIVKNPAPPGPPDREEKKVQMFFMASYHLDQFKKFVFESRLKEVIPISGETLTKCGESEEALLSFAFTWLRYFLFGEQIPDLAPVEPKADKMENLWKK